MTNYPPTTIDRILHKIARGGGVHAWSMAKSASIAALTPENLKEAEHKLKPKLLVPTRSRLQLLLLHGLRQIHALSKPMIASN